jgi:hypothetical protein
VLENALLMALPPYYLPKIIEGLARLSTNGLRYPIVQFGIQSAAHAATSSCRLLIDILKQLFHIFYQLCNLVDHLGSIQLVV